VAFDHEKENDNYSIMECDKHFNNDIKNKDPFKKRIEDTLVQHTPDFHRRCMLLDRNPVDFFPIR
jgi:hypothetical protein